MHKWHYLSKQNTDVIPIDVMLLAGMGPMPWTINAEIYPLWARGAGNGASTFCNWLFNLCSSISFLSLTEAIGAHGSWPHVNLIVHVTLVH